MEVRFQEEVTACLHAAPPLRSNEKVILLSVYLGMVTSSVRLEEIVQDVVVAWMVAAILLDMENKLVVLQITRAN